MYLKESPLSTPHKTVSSVTSHTRIPCDSGVAYVRVWRICSVSARSLQLQLHPTHLCVCMCDAVLTHRAHINEWCTVWQTLSTCYRRPLSLLAHGRLAICRFYSVFIPYEKCMWNARSIKCVPLYATMMDACVFLVFVSNLVEEKVHHKLEVNFIEWLKSVD